MRAKPHNKRQARKNRSSIRQWIIRLIWRILPKDETIHIVNVTSLIMLLFASDYMIHAAQPPGMCPQVLMLLKQIAGIVLATHFIMNGNGPRDG